METLAYTHLCTAQEEVNIEPDAYDLKLFNFNCKPPSSAWIWLLSTVMAIALLNMASSAIAAYVRTNGRPLNIRSSPNGAVVGNLRNGSSVSLSGRTSGGWAQLSSGNWVASRYVRSGSGGGGGSPSRTFLQRGSSGTSVSNLQTKLKNAGFFKGRVTGYYGSQTEAAVRNFQATYKLRVDGIAGPQTLASINDA